MKIAFDASGGVTIESEDGRRWSFAALAQALRQANEFPEPVRSEILAAAKAAGLTA